MAIPEAERLREEDPFTARWVDIAPTRIVGRFSRFQLDLNRTRDGAIYLTPEQSWGLKVWRSRPDAAIIKQTLAAYDAFYRAVRDLLDAKLRSHDRLVVYDLHTYNHRRDGRDAAPASADGNPQVNIGTGTLTDRTPWRQLIERFMSDLSAQRRPDGSPFDVRENVKFQGGQFGRWIHQAYPGRVCVLSIEFKKFFMDEWTGQGDEAEIVAIHRALAQTTAGVLEELNSP